MKKSKANRLKEKVLAFCKANNAPFGYLYRKAKKEYQKTPPHLREDFLNRL